MKRRFRQVRHCGSPINIPLRHASCTMALSSWAGLTMASTKVASWLSRHGAITFAQGTDGNRPTTATVANRTAVAFGATQYMTSATTFASIYTATLKMFLSVAQTDSVASTQRFFSDSGNAQWNTYTSASALYARTNGNGGQVGISPTLTQAKAQIYTAYQSGTTQALAVNNVWGAVGTAASTSTNNGLLLSDSTGSYPWLGKLMELITYNTVLHQRDINRIYKKELSRKYL